MFDREKVIDTLIADDLIQFNLDHVYFNDTLRNGFIGYDNMDDEELITECEDRDISYLVGEDD